MVQTAKPKLIRNCRLSVTPSEGNQRGDDMLLMPEGVLRLKGTGAAIVALCDGTRSLEQIVEQLQSQYPSADPAQIGAEAIAFLKTLREKRVVDF
jgi:pyrroloquinoline quinone biosynthesis protein D